MNASDLTESARGKWKAGDSQGALRDLDEAVRLDPGHADALQMRGVVSTGLKDLEGALRDLDEAVRLDPAMPKAHYNRGIALEEAGRMDEALRAYERAAELDPDYELARLAVDDLRTRPLVEAARRKFDAEDYGGTARAMDEALARHPDSPALHHLRGVARLRMDDAAGALSDLDATLRADPRNSRAHYNRGISLRNLGRREEARVSIRRALEIDPSYKLAQEELAALEQDLQASPAPKPAPAPAAAATATPPRKSFDWGMLGCGLVLAVVLALLLYYAGKQAADVCWKAAHIALNFPPKGELCYREFCLRSDTTLPEGGSGTILRFHGCPDHPGTVIKRERRLSTTVLGAGVFLLYWIVAFALTLLIVPAAGALFRVGLWPVLVPMRLAGKLPPGRLIPFLRLAREDPAPPRWFDAGPEMAGMLAGLLAVVAAWGLYLWW